MLKKISGILLLLIASFPSYADCLMSDILKNKICGSDYFLAKNQKQLSEYLQYGKFKEGKLLNLEIGFDYKEKEINIGTSCDIKLKYDADLRATLNGICIQGKNIFIRRKSSLVAEKKAPITLIANDSIKIRHTIIQTAGDVNISTKTFDPFEKEILISRDSQILSDKIKINTPSSLIINDGSKIKSSSVILNGGNCEVADNNDQDNDDNRDHERLCKKFKPNFTYSGSCLNNPIPTTIKILSNVDKIDSLKINYSVAGIPSNTLIKWKFDNIITSSNLTSAQTYIFPGRHLSEAVVYSTEGYFRKIGTYNNISPTKLKKGQTVIFQFNGLKINPPKVVAMMGIKIFSLTRSVQNPELYL